MRPTTPPRVEDDPPSTDVFDGGPDVENLRGKIDALLETCVASSDEFHKPIMREMEAADERRRHDDQRRARRNQRALFIMILRKPGRLELLDRGRRGTHEAQ